MEIFHAPFLSLPSFKFTTYENSSIMRWRWFSFHHQRLFLGDCSNTFWWRIYITVQLLASLQQWHPSASMGQCPHQSNNNTTLSFNAASMWRVGWENRLSCSLSVLWLYPLHHFQSQQKASNVPRVLIPPDPILYCGSGSAAHTKGMAQTGQESHWLAGGLGTMELMTHRCPRSSYRKNITIFA